MRDNSHSPGYYADMLNNAIQPQTSGLKTRAEQLLSIAKKIAGNNKQQPTLRTIILELKMQCQCRPLTFIS